MVINLKVSSVSIEFDVILKNILLNEEYCIFIEIALKFVPQSPIDNWQLVQVMTWYSQTTSHYQNHRLAKIQDAMWCC